LKIILAMRPVFPPPRFVANDNQPPMTSCGDSLRAAAWKADRTHPGLRQHLRDAAKLSDAIDALGAALDHLRQAIRQAAGVRTA